MTINPCGPSQGQVKMNMPQERREGTTNTLEGGTPHQSSLDEDFSSLEGRGTSLQSIHQKHQSQDGEMDLILEDASDDFPSKGSRESPMTITALGPSQDQVMNKRKSRSARPRTTRK